MKVKATHSIWLGDIHIWGGDATYPKIAEILQALSSQDFKHIVIAVIHGGGHCLNWVLPNNNMFFTDKISSVFWTDHYLIYFRIEKLAHQSPHMPSLPPTKKKGRNITNIDLDKMARLIGEKIPIEEFTELLSGQEKIDALINGLSEAVTLSAPEK